MHDLSDDDAPQFVAGIRSGISDMGSRASKLHPPTELPSALRPIHRKIEEVKKRRRKRSRRYSIVSATELLHPDDNDGPDAGSGSSTKAEGPEEEVCTAAAQLPKVVEEEVQYLTSDEGPEEASRVEKKKQEAQPAAPAPATKKQTEAMVEEEDDRKLRAVTAKRGDGREEMPGSPSFRIYFPGPIHDPDDDPVIFLEQLSNNKDELGKHHLPGSGVAHVGANSKDHHLDSNEDSESKQQQQGKKAARMRKWRAITKANTAVQHMLNVRTCYSNPAAMVASKQHGSTSQLLMEKAA